MAEPTNRRWGVGSNQYKKRPGISISGSSSPELSAAPRLSSRSGSSIREEATGITWETPAVDFQAIKASTQDRVRARFRSSLAEYIWDAAALEGNPYTLPEVQTLLEGVTVGGHKLEDEEQILALNVAYNQVDKLVGTGLFELDKPTSDTLHGEVAVHEAIESGHFRGEGAVGGGGMVGLGALGTYQASSPGDGGSNLIQEHDQLLDYLGTLRDPREQALAYFCAATRRQFYFDGNKRTARLMMAGHLMSHGYDAISISANRRAEFNTHLGELFDQGDANQMMQFIISCRPTQ
jgi:hypothetical protein